MILANITRALREQNWLAVAVEFTIVVLGVVIGFQVTDWAGARNDRETERRHLQEIADDLRGDLESFEFSKTSASNRMAAARHILGEARGEILPDRLVMPGGDLPVPELPSANEISDVHLLSSLNAVQQRAGQRTGFESLINSGNLPLIRNRDLSRAIQQYYSGQISVATTMNIFRNVRHDGMNQFYALGLSTFGEVPSARLIDIAREDDAFAAYVRTMDEWAIISTRVYNRESLIAADLLAAIEAELGETP